MRVTPTLLLGGMCCLVAQATSVSYMTPTGSMVSGNAVDANVTFTTGSGRIEITLNNLLADPHDETQNLSDLSFTVNGNVSGASFAATGNSASLINIASGGSFMSAGTAATGAAIGWSLSSSSTAVTLDVLTGPGHLGPTRTIVGPPDPSTNFYDHENGSVGGNPAYNPFISETATWVISAPNVSVDTKITSVSFSFGTSPGTGSISGEYVPEPGFSGVVALSLAGILIGVRRRRTDSARA